MTKQPSTDTLATPEPRPGEADRAFDALERTLRDSGPLPALAELIEHLDAAGEYRACSTRSCSRHAMSSGFR